MWGCQEHRRQAFWGRLGNEIKAMEKSWWSQISGWTIILVKRTMACHTPSYDTGEVGTPPTACWVPALTGRNFWTNPLSVRIGFFKPTAGVASLRIGRAPCAKDAKEWKERPAKKPARNVRVRGHDGNQHGAVCVACCRLVKAA